jgi:hypothetical protein
MPKFTVQCTITEDWQVEVEADSEDEAIEKVENMRFHAIRDGDNQLDDDRIEVHSAAEN